MNHFIPIITLLLWSSILLANPTYEELTADFVRGEAEIASMSVLSFGPEGILFIGDAKGGKIFALDLEDRELRNSNEPFGIENLEPKLGSLLGTDAKGIIIHDMAVNSISQNVYLAVSRGDAMQLGFWRLPNDINYAGILIRITPDGAMEEVSLKDIRHSVSTLPKMIESGPHPWREADKRSEAITDIAFADGRLYVAGLSNEEFASCLRVLDFPFSDEPGAFCTIEVFHVAHGKSETEAPIRTLLPYDINGVPHILASYTCTPFVSIPVSELQPGRHVKSKTLGEFGFGNMPIDMVGFEKNGKSLLLMSSNSKALIRIDPEDIPRQKEGLVQPLEKGAYTAGLPHYVWSVVGVTQLDNLNKDNLMALQRMPNGALDLRALSVKWF